MLDLAELDFYIQQAFGGKVPRSQYFTAALYTSDKTTQIKDAEILNWTDENYDWPTEANIAVWKDKYGPSYLEHKSTSAVRVKRDLLLKEADVLVYKAMDSDDDNKVKAAKVYRQSLRDVPQQEGFPSAVIWPDFTL